MTRGFSWQLYEADDGRLFALQVDADYAAEPARGWGTPAGADTPPLPRGWRARYVLGLDPLGNTRRAVVASVSAGLWSGVDTEFTIEANDNSTVTCVVIGRVQERNRPSPG